MVNMDSGCMMILVVATLLYNSLSVAGDLQQLNQDHIDPLHNQEDQDHGKDHSKRTIFGPTHPKIAWAKHVAVRPNGLKHVIGYSPVDLKYTAVVRPVIRHPGYHYDKPKIQLQLKRPGGWKPIKPVGLPVNVPPPASKPIHFDHFHTTAGGHLDVVHDRPVHHVDHIHTRPEHVYAHIDHIHQVPVPVSFPIQQVAVAPHPVAVKPLVPLVPQAVPVPAAPAVVHHPVPLPPPSPYFEVTRPNLGVLPFGAVFQTPVLKEIPAPNLRPILPAPAAPVAPFLPAPQPVAPAVPVAPIPAPPPGVSVEYHGSTGFVNQVPVNAAHPILPNHFHLQYPQIPQHAQAPEPHYINPHVHQVGQPHFQEAVHPHQHLPNGQIDFQEAGHNIYQQNVPTSDGGGQFQQEQQPDQNQLHYSPADQVSSQQFYQGEFHGFQSQHQDQGYSYPQPGSVQPGQTDLQLPLHLPHHPGFEAHGQEQLQQVGDGTFRPSIQLEPPYNKK